MQREIKIKFIPAVLAIFFVFSWFILALQKVAFSSFTTPVPIDVQYILSTRPRNVELPFGGTSVLPENRYVALYGSPLYEALGALGEQSIDASISAARKLAQKYQPFSDEPVIPTLEIITTIASATATQNDDYSQETEVSKLKPWIKKAYENGIYILLDLQPGRRSFLSQAKQYEELLLQPHVGLALDPEWRLGSNELHLQQIGSVSASEVNQVLAWLSELVENNDLPEKMFLLHQFTHSMLENRHKIDTSYENLDIVIQMDGQGTKAGKLDTYEAITSDAPENIYFGWKNFYDEDTYQFSPEETMKLSPKPWYVSYQ